MIFTENEIRELLYEKIEISKKCQHINDTLHFYYNENPEFFITNLTLKTSDMIFQLGTKNIEDTLHNHYNHLLVIDDTMSSTFQNFHSIVVIPDKYLKKVNPGFRNNFKHPNNK